MKTYFISITFFLISLMASSQCDYSYRKYVKKADRELKKGNKADFKLAINSYLTAIELCRDNDKIFHQKILITFDKIESLKQEAIQDKIVAREAERDAKIQKKIAQNERDTNKRIIDKMYFYDGKFGLSFNGEKWGFIDKKGNTKIDFKYESAGVFNAYGFARVEDNGKKLLIDTAGHNYKLAESLREVNKSTQAIIIKNERIDLNQFLDIDSIVYIECTKTQINTIPEDLRAWNNLKVLSLNDNELDTIPKGLGTLNNLEVLNLSKNNISKVPIELTNINNLKILSFLDNNLDNIPEKLSDLKNLESLNLIGNNISKIPKELGSLDKLKKLSLSYNKIDTIPKEFGKLSNLEKLELTNNNINKVPKELGSLGKLKNLSLSYNKIDTIPKEFGKLSNLKTLQLYDNKLTELPKDLGKLKKLQKLYLSKNKLIEIPKELGNLKNLKILKLSRNELPTIPKELGKLNNLEELNLSKNNLSTIHYEFGDLKKLKVLNLSNNNNIKKLPSNFRKCENLVHLHLYQTLLSKDEKKIEKLLMLLPNVKIRY